MPFVLRKWPYKEPEGGAEWSDGVHQCRHHSCWTWAWKWSQVPRFDVLKFWNEWNASRSFVFMKFYEDITTNMNDNKLISFHPFLWPSTISRALQLVHSVVLDTSAVFPHYCGLPYRRSLRSLVSSYLKVSIVDKIALRLGNLTLKDRQHRQCVDCPVWPLHLLCLYLRCFKWRFRQNVFLARDPVLMGPRLIRGCSGLCRPHALEG